MTCTRCHYRPPEPGSAWCGPCIDAALGLDRPPARIEQIAFFVFAGGVICALFALGLLVWMAVTAL